MIPASPYAPCEGWHGYHSGTANLIGEDMQAITVIRSTADAIQTLAGTAPNAKTAREALPDHATAIRACPSIEPEVLKAADAIETAAHNLRSMTWNAKHGVMEELSDLALALYMMADDMQEAPATNRLDEIVQEVRAAQESIASAAIRIGALLIEARDEFESQSEFLKWAKENVGYGKTMAFRLMKLHRELGDTEAVSDMSLIALHTLTGIDEESKAKVVDMAQARKEAGESAPTADEVKAVAAESAPSTPVDNDEEAGDGIASAAGEPAPWAADAPQASKPDDAPAPMPASTGEDVQALYDLIETLRAELAEARKGAADKGGKSKAPMLPQFRNDCYAARLGLSEAQAADPAKVKRALRDLVRAGYNSQHEAYAALAEAADALTTQAQAA